LLGRKAGKGFYLYPKDAKKGAKKEVNPEVRPTLQQQPSLRSINA